jgi:hypothetical protein
MKKLLTTLLLILSTALFAQTRISEKTRIYVPRVTGGTAEQQKYFYDNFRMEIEGAQYLLADTETEGDYKFALTITDGIEDGELRHSLLMELIDLHDGQQVLAYSWDFDTDNPDEMNEWNLYFIYQAMANVLLAAMHEETGATPHYMLDEGEKDRLQLSEAERQQLLWEETRWRNKWWYIDLYGVGGFNRFKESESWQWVQFVEDNVTINHFQRWAPQGGAGIGVELQFLNRMSAEIDFDFTINYFGDASFFNVSIPFKVKLPLKPGRSFMLEPYAGAQINVPLDNKVEIPLTSLLVGAQGAAKAGKSGGLFVDLKFGYDLGTTTVHPEGLSDGEAERIFLQLGIGYKFGFLDRPSTLKPVNEAP